MTQEPTDEVFEIEGALKTTRMDKLVIQVTQFLANQCVVGEVFTLDGKRQFRMTSKGQPFPVATEREVLDYVKRTNNSKTQARRDLMGVYLYVTEVISPGAAPTVAAETCAACGSAAGMYCPMSDDGEGPHDIVTIAQ